MIKKWVEEDWNSLFHNPPTPASSVKIIYAGARGAQQTPDVKHCLHKSKATLINVPGGTTDRVQPLDVSINTPFKNYVCKLIEQHVNANLELYVDGKLTVGVRCVLSTKWVSKTCGCVKKQKDVTKHSFIKCDLSSNLDGSEDSPININSIKRYKMLFFEKEELEEIDSEGLGEVLYTLCTFYCEFIFY